MYTKTLSSASLSVILNGPLVFQQGKTILNLLMYHGIHSNLNQKINFY